MSSDNPGKSDPSAKTEQRDGGVPNVGDRLKPADVPVFNCIVYVLPAAEGGVRARVANLSGLECTAASERAALGQIVPAFKKRVGEFIQNKTPIPWIEPPAPVAAGEQTRFIPVHL